MTTFATFASSFRYLSNNNVTDVNTIISDFRSETVTNGSPAWTEPTSQNFKSPVDTAGRFFTVILTRTAATRLEWKVTDQNGTTICDREIDITSSPATTVNYYTGQSHAWVESFVATPEIAVAGILDSSPLSVGSYAVCVYGNGYKNTGASVDGNFSTTGQLFMLDNGGSAQTNRLRAIGVNIANSQVGLLDPAGNSIYVPNEIATNIGGTFRWNGRMFQTMLVDTSNAVGSLKTVIIGTAGELGTFRVIGGLALTENMRWAVRQA